jgi:hypothetical protein
LDCGLWRQSGDLSWIVATEWWFVLCCGLRWQSGDLSCIADCGDRVVICLVLWTVATEWWFVLCCGLWWQSGDLSCIVDCGDRVVICLVLWTVATEWWFVLDCGLWRQSGIFVFHFITKILKYTKYEKCLLTIYCIFFQLFFSGKLNVSRS